MTCPIFSDNRSSYKSDEIWRFCEKNLFLSILNYSVPLALKVEKLGQNWSSRAKRLATSIFLHEEYEKIGPETRFLLTMFLKYKNRLVIVPAQVIKSIVKKYE